MAPASNIGGVLAAEEPLHAFDRLLVHSTRDGLTNGIMGLEVKRISEQQTACGGDQPQHRSFDRQQALRRNDPSRDAHPSFKDQIAGIPTWCAKPQGAKKNPSWGVIQHDGTTTNLISPWAVVRPVKPVPSFRNVPTTLTRTRSLPGLGASRVNQAAVTAGTAAVNASTTASPGPLFAEQAQDVPMVEQSPLADGGADRLKRSVSIANAQSSQQRMPSEQEMLMEEVGDRYLGEEPPQYDGRWN